MSGASSLVYRRWQAPAENGATLLEPTGANAEAARAANAARLSQAELVIADRPLRDWRRQAKRELAVAAAEYTRGYRADVDLAAVASQDFPLWMAGHQPQLFHPGVWLKNFVLSRQAAACGGVAINLVIDNDLLRTPSIRVPTGSATAPRVVALPFDAATAELPFEERQWEDSRVSAEFPGQVADALRTLVPDPFIYEFWPTVQERQAHTANLGETLSQARHLWEADWGARTWELPISRVAKLPSWSAFVAHIVEHVERFVTVHNRALAEYRRVHHLRGTLHPIPNLVHNGDWLEAPFWTWTADAPARRRLFVQRHGCDVLLSDRAGWETRLCARDLSPALEQLESSGRKLRPRALTTTLFARLFAADLFVHGIGGAKYDQVADLIIAQFFHVSPPAYMVVTGTLHLPVAAPPLTEADVQQAASAMRSFEFHPETFLTEASLAEAAAAEPWVREKRTALQTPGQPTPRAFCQTIRRANVELGNVLARVRNNLEQHQQRIAVAARDTRLLHSREYAFCLHSAGSLRAFLRVNSR